MKKKTSNPIEKKKKQANPIKDEKLKDKKIFTPISTTERSNVPTQASNNPKSKKNNYLTDLSCPVSSRKKSEPKLKVVKESIDDKNTKGRPRVFSHSPNRGPAPKNPKEKTLNQKTLTELKFKPLGKFTNTKSQNNLKVQNQNLMKDSKELELSKKKSIEEEKNEEVKENEPKENYDPNLYGFNLYKHVKENLVNKDKLCKDKLTKGTYYCIDCKLSTCKKCPNFNIHKGHTLIPKYLYYDCDPKIFEDTFKCVDTILAENPDYLDNKKLKETLKKTVTESIDTLVQRLNKIKEEKLKELDKLFESTDGCLDALKKKRRKFEK